MFCRIYSSARPQSRSPAILHQVGDLENLRIPGQQVLGDHVDLELAEVARKPDVLLGRDLLAAKHHHAVGVEHGVEFFERRFANVLREVDAFGQMAKSRG